MATTGSHWSDAQVRAFVEGTLDASATAQFSAQVQQDLALAERVARQRAQRRQAGASEAGGAPRPAPSTHRGPAPLWWGVTLAAVVIAALAGWSLPRGKSEQALVPDTNGLTAGGRLAQALDERIAAEGSKAGGVLVSLTFQAGDGRYCRTFSLDSGVDGLACRDGTQWRVESIGRSPAPGGPYREASSELSPSVIAAISRWQAGDALTPEQERRVRDQGWQ